MDDQLRYEQIDMPFYRSEVAPVLPEKVLDFHTHIWTRDQWKTVPWESDVAGGSYMVTDLHYGYDQLLADCITLFPDRPYEAVCFGNPGPDVVLEKTNAYAAEAGRQQSLYPLMVTEKDGLPPAELEQSIISGGFYGYKIRLNWHGNDYGSMRVQDMIGPAEMRLANERKLVVLLHVPREGRLADPEVQQGVRELSKDYPEANIVLAHCGRAYLPDEMKQAISSVRDLPNVYLDTTMVMDPTVLQIVFDNIDSKRVLFGTDLPIAGMRGRRVYVMDHWVDVVLEGYPPSAYRVACDSIRATYMAYEIILAIRRAAEMAGLSANELAGIFYGNGNTLLLKARREG